MSGARPSSVRTGLCALVYLEAMSVAICDQEPPGVVEPYRDWRPEVFLDMI